MVEDGGGGVWGGGGGERARGFIFILISQAVGVGVVGKSKGRRYPIPGTLTHGRGRENKIPLQRTSNKMEETHMAENVNFFPTRRPLIKNNSKYNGGPLKVGEKPRNSSALPPITPPKGPTCESQGKAEGPEGR